MLRNIKDLFGYPIMASDGKSGKVMDVLFGDRNWRMRYLDVETRRGFRLNLRYLSEEEKSEDRVTRRLIETKDLEALDFGPDRRIIKTFLDTEEIKKCEGFGSHLTVEERYEMEFRRFHGHTNYDERPFFGSFGYAGHLPSVSAYDHTEKEIREHLDRMSEIAGEHLHSAKAVLGYHVAGLDGSLGIVGDLILDVSSWSISYLVLDTRHGIPSRKYLLDMSDVQAIEWPSSTMEVKLTNEDVTSRRRYWVHDPVNVTDDEEEYDYSGRPCSKSFFDGHF